MSLLSQQSQVNVDTAFFAPASGGGGGGGGPNLALSSLVMNGLTAGTGGVISWAYDFPFTTTGIPNGQVGLQQGVVQDSGGGNTNAVMTAVNDGSGGGLTADFAAGRVIVGVQGTGGSATARPTLFELNGLLNISPGASISSLTVSSINGAAPGGGGSVGPVLTNISTIQMNPSNATITLDNTGPGVLSILNNQTGAVNDIRLFTNQPANSFVTNFQPGGAANLIQTLAPGAAGSALNFGVSDAGGAVLAAADDVNGNPSTLTVASDNLKLLQPIADGSELRLVASDTDLYDIACVSSSVYRASLSLGRIGGRDQVYMDTAEVPNFYTSTITGSTGVIALNPSGTEQIRIGGVGAPGDISVNTTGGGSIILNGLVSTTTTVNVGGAPALVNIAGGANAIQLRSDNLATATIWATGAGGLALSTISNLNGGEPLVMNPQSTQIPAFVQSGYLQDVPNASTILFSIPYTTDSIAVHLTPTNRNTSGGANPNLSLNNSFGTTSRGVSSIGFQVDARDQGVGYNGSFFWMAMPTNQ